MSCFSPGQLLAAGACIHFKYSTTRIHLQPPVQELVDGKSRWVAKGMGKGEVLFDGVDAPSEGGEYEVLYLHPTPADTASSAATIGLFAPTAASSWWPAFSPLRLLSKADGGGSFVPHSTPSSSVLSAAPPSNKKRENALARSPVIVVHGPTVSPQLAWPEGARAVLFLCICTLFYCSHVAGGCVHAHITVHIYVVAHIPVVHVCVVAHTRALWLTAHGDVHTHMSFNWPNFNL